ncbi:hypothetical protein Kfla_6225 [Kribbella flavida DSM 17836]|uniref:DUF8129 domain-containing protein n=1 Tax=Kribbella flavida (strain DSM 17836 / JCM 10339 / NBRC 14399) TaxID=479435 RepID=D2PVI8_KRIFD|nr:hypothetical protein [Kribbella flavida]ADB35228.1 hypothetical protein Kfla_6225 [Kribbella flavida DSM 17836]
MTTRPEGALPLPDYDHIPFGSLAARVRTLDIQQLEQLIGYERNHAQRILVLELLEHRRDELKAGAEPTSGSPTAFMPETAGPPDSGSVVGAESGPAINPPAHGDPTNPSQPRT